MGQYFRDGEPNWRRLEAMARRGWGRVANMAEDGEAAWAVLSDADVTTRYAALITDCHMPRLDGYGLVDAFARMKARVSARGSPSSR